MHLDAGILALLNGYIHFHFQGITKSPVLLSSLFKASIEWSMLKWTNVITSNGKLSVQLQIGSITNSCRFLSALLFAFDLSNSWKYYQILN